MATKVKGEAIKEGSIPMSALSTEVKNKIENAGSKVFVFTDDMVKSENEDGSINIDPANAIEMINSDFINMMDVYNMEKTYTYGDFAVFSFTLKLDPLMSQVIVMYVYSEGVIGIMSAREEHPFVYDSDSGENENKVRKRLSLLDLALGDSDRKDYTAYIDEVKENVKKNLGITDAVTPDWNAQKGEPGYIKNKPLRFVDGQGKEYKFTNPLKQEDFIPVPNEYNEVYKYKQLTYAQDLQYVVVNKSESAYGGMYETQYRPVSKQNNAYRVNLGEYSGYVYIEEDENCDYWLVVEMDFPDYFFPENTIYVIYDYEDLVEIEKISEQYLPNTVFKTTPQTLSATDKNQALTNLGIDPVVWKYICNPCIVEFDRTTYECNSAIPEELSDIIYQNGKFNSLVLSTVLIKIYYPLEEGDEVVWKVEKITSYNEGCVIFDGEEFGYDPNTRKFVF